MNLWYVIAKRGLYRGKPLTVSLPPDDELVVPVFHTREDAERFQRINPDAKGPEQSPRPLTDNGLANALEVAGRQRRILVAEFPENWEHRPLGLLKVEAKELGSFAHVLHARKDP